MTLKYMFAYVTEEQTILANEGLFCFYENELQEFCLVRKVKPLNKALEDLSSWITSPGQGQDSDPKAGVLVVQVDLSFEGIDGRVGTRVKWSSMANLDTQEIWNSFLATNVAFNSVHSQVQTSFECQLCPRLVFPRQRKKVGWWSWEETRSGRCLLHRGNIVLNVHIDGSVPINDSARIATIKAIIGMEDSPWLIAFYLSCGCKFFQVIESSYAEPEPQVLPLQPT